MSQGKILGQGQILGQGRGQGQCVCVVAEMSLFTALMAPLAD